MNIVEITDLVDSGDRGRDLVEPWPAIDLTHSLPAGFPADGRKRADAGAKDKMLSASSETKSLAPSDEAVELAKLTLSTSAMATTVVHAFSTNGDDIDILMRILDAQVDAVHAGDLRSVESMLAAQAFTLNAIFSNLALRAARYVAGDSLQATETCLRLGLKAQAQCRATLETLAAIKRSAVAFQANIAVGPQQVSNGGQPPAGEVDRQNQPIKLLGERDGTRLDDRAASGTGGGDPALAAVDVVDWPPDAGRQGTRDH